MSISIAVEQSIVGHMTQEMTKHYMSHATTQAKQEAIEKLPASPVMNDTIKIPNVNIRKRLAELAYTAEKRLKISAETILFVIPKSSISPQ